MKKQSCIEIEADRRVTKIVVQSMMSRPEYNDGEVCHSALMEKTLKILREKRIWKEAIEAIMQPPKEMV